MDRKTHWAWPHFAEGRVPLDRLRSHFRQEWAVYVRDFPMFLARVMGHGPPTDAREALAANLYEEQTGGISHTAPHPELFLRMMDACGYVRADFDAVTLLPAAAEYRAWLDAQTTQAPWWVGFAVTAIFVEGSANERADLATPPHAGPVDEAEIARAVAAHPLVRVHKIPADAMQLTRVHRTVEAGHRHDAWRIVERHATDADAAVLVGVLEDALARWLAYRDAVAEACGLVR